MESYDLNQKDDRTSVSGLRVSAMGHLLLPTVAAFAVPAAFGVEGTEQVPSLVLGGWILLCLSISCNLLFMLFVPWWVKDKKLGNFLNIVFGGAIVFLLFGVGCIALGVFGYSSIVAKVCARFLQ